MYSHRDPFDSGTYAVTYFSFRRRVGSPCVWLHDPHPFARPRRGLRTHARTTKRPPRPAAALSPIRRPVSDDTRAPQASEHSTRAQQYQVPGLVWHKGYSDRHFARATVHVEHLAAPLAFQCSPPYVNLAC
eukprot:6209767-Pleurochrysis_carterae.AAC.3